VADLHATQVGNDANLVLAASFNDIILIDGRERPQGGAARAPISLRIRASCSAR
jgi:hypothetical protein